MEVCENPLYPLEYMWCETNLWLHELPKMSTEYWTAREPYHVNGSKVINLQTMLRRKSVYYKMAGQINYNYNLGRKEREQNLR